MAAGYPSANSFSAAISQRIWPDLGNYDSLNRFNFSEVAEYAESLMGRHALLNTVDELLTPPQRVRPTPAHMLAVTKFKAIVTTNFDNLFEVACRTQDIPYLVITPTSPETISGEEVVRIFKIAGTIDIRDSLRITTSDLTNVHETYVYREAMFLLANNPVAVVGHSLRDGRTAELMTARGSRDDGIYVSPHLELIDEVMLSRFRLKGLKEHADSFLERFYDGSPSRS